MSNSTNVETNVVQMRFDNKRFEKNVSQTMNSLDKLKKELKFDDSAKSFKTLEENAKKVDFSPLSKGIEKVQASFSFLDTFSATVYHRLSNRLIDIGKKITTSVSTEGIRSGFNEYELKMNSFKTIKASAGKDFTDSQINEYLEELNKYADKTIYSFSDMTNNIGKFTNAGVKLDTAVKAIKGISNEAAISGANAQEASRAMYNFSQALSSGYVKLIDWKSIELANMATEEFKNELIETAVSVGKLTKAQNGMYKTQKGKLLNSTQGFNDALQDQWMTTEVLTKTLEKYADETTDIGKKAFEAAQKVNTFTKLIDTLKEAIQSGWSQTWELLVGNLEEATKLWTAVSDKIGGVIDAFFKEKKAVLENWKAHHGRERTLAALTKIMHNLGDVLRGIGTAWRSVFPKATVNTMMRFTEGLENIAKKTVMTKSRMDPLIDTFKGIFAAIGIVLDVVKAFKQTFGKFFIRVLADALHTLFGVSGSLGQMLAQVRENLKANETFKKTFESIVNVLEWVYSGVKKVTDVLWNLVKAVGSVVTNNGGFNAFKGWFDGLKKAITSFDIVGIGKSIVSFFRGLWKIIDGTIEKTFNFYKPFKKKMSEAKNAIVNSRFGQWIIGFYKGIVDGVQKIFNSFGDVKTDGIDKMNENATKKVSVFQKIINFFKKVWAVIKGIALTIWPYIKDIAKSIGAGIQMLFSGVTENIRNSTMGDAGGLLAGAGLLTIAASMKKFVKNMKPLFDTFKVFSSGGKFLKNIFDILNNATKFLKAKILKEIAISILMLSGALFLLCTIPTQKLVGATAAMGTLFQGMTAVFKAIDGVNSTGLEDSTDKSGNKLATGGAGRLIGIASTLMALSIAMVVLVAAIKKLSGISVENITKGVIVIGTLFAVLSSAVTSILEVGKFTKTMGTVDIRARGVGNVIKSFGKAILFIMAAFWILSKIASNISKMENGQELLTKLFAWMMLMIGLIGGIMVLITKFSKEQTAKGLNVNVKSIKAGFGLIGIAVALQQFAIAMVAILAAIAVIALIVHKKGINGGDMAQVIGAMLGAVTVTIGAIATMVGLAKITKPGDVIRVMGLLASISLFMSALSWTLLKLSMLPTEWAVTGSSALMSIAASIGIVTMALGYFMKSVNRRMNNKIQTKQLTKVLAAITLSIVVLSAAVAGISVAIKGNNVWAIVGVLLAMAGAIAAICAAVGRFDSFRKGFDGLTKGLAAIGIAAAGFAGAAALIIFTLRQISKMSDSEINEIGTNMKKIATAILNASDQIIGILAGLVRIVVETVISTTVTTLIGSAGEIVDGIGKLCDILLVKAPTIVNKILQILVEVITEIERGMGPVVARIVSAVITLISEVAKAIRDNADRIVQAIDDVLTAIAVLVSRGIAKIFSIDQFKGAVKALEVVVKPVSVLLIGMFAYNKVKTGAAGVVKILQTLGKKIKAFGTNIKSLGLKGGITKSLGIDKLKQDWDLVKAVNKSGLADTRVVLAEGAKTLGKSFVTGAGIGLALGTLVKAWGEAKIAAIDVTTSWVEDTDKAFGKLSKTVENNVEELRKHRAELQDAMLGVDTKYDTSESKLNRLMNLIDEKTGRIKDGKEKEAANLVNDINSQLGEQLVIEDRVLKMLDAHGQARQFELEQLQNIIATEKLREKLEERKKAKEEAEKRLPDYEKTRDESKETFDKAPSVEAYNKGLSNLVDYYSKLQSGTINGRAVNKEDWDNFNKLLANFNETFKYAEAKFTTGNIATLLESDDGESRYSKEIKKKVLENYRNKKSNYIIAQYAYQSLVDEINQYYDAERALEENNLDRIKQYNAAFSGFYKLGATDSKKETEANRLATDVKNAISKSRETVYGTIKAEYEAAKQYYTELGKTAELESLEEDWNKYTEARDALYDTQKKEAKETSNGLDDLKKKATDKVKDVVGEFATPGVNGGWGIQEKVEDGIKAAMTSTSGGSGGQSAFEKYGMSAGNAFASVVDSIFESTIDDLKSVGQLFQDVTKNGAVTSMADDLISKLQSSIFPAIAGLSGNSIPFTGVTPVNFGLDQNGSGLFGAALPVNGALPYDSHLANITAILQMHSENMMNQTNIIISEIGNLRNDVVALGAHIDDMELSLDGDALVGGLTPRLNNALYTYSRRVERGL